MEGTVSTVFARKGDRLVVRSCPGRGAARDGEILEVPHADGGPPYRVRWSDNGHVSLVFPGPGALVDHYERFQTHREGGEPQ
jgi:hypothetical protein